MSSWGPCKHLPAECGRWVLSGDLYGAGGRYWGGRHREKARKFQCQKRVFRKLGDRVCTLGCCAGGEGPTVENEARSPPKGPIGGAPACPLQ